METPEMERRTIRVAELRVAGDETAPVIEGYAAVIGQWSDDLGGFREIIATGAFTPVLAQQPDVRALFNHDANYVVGRTRAGTLSLAEDEKGLAMRAWPPETQWARDLLVTMRRGDVNQMSFGFWVERDRWEEDEDGNVRRTILEFRELFDVSVVTFPAFPQTSAQVRAAVAEIRTRKGQGPEGAQAEAEHRAQAGMDAMRRRLRLAQ